MRKILILTIFLFLAVSLLIAEESVALAIKVSGNVNLTREKKNEELALGQMLFNNDVISTDNEAFAALKFVDGSSLLKLFPNSVMEINTNKENKKINKKNKLNLGDLWSKVTGKMGNYELETPTTVVSVKGTEFIVSVSEEGYTTLYTLEGKVNIRNKSNNKEEDVEAGFKAFSSGDGEILVSEYDPEEIPEEAQNEILEIHLRNDEGDEKTIRFEVE